MRGGWRALALLASLVAAGGLGARPASAAFHVMMVKEVFAGTPVEPGAQYVVLQAWDLGQNAVTGHGVRVYDAAGTLLQTFTFTGSVSSGADQMTILVATEAAETLLGVDADLVMTSPVIPPAGGKVCWDGFDCVAWGTYAVAGDAAVGDPVNVDGGIPPCQAIRRRLDAGDPGLLDDADDTDDSASDFQLSEAPSPRNNGGVLGALPALACPAVVVTIATTASPATEAGPTAGAFTVTRSDPAGALAVDYTVSGTAVPGADYAPPLSGTVTFDPGEPTAVITVTPVDDPDPELTETVVVALQSHPTDYVAGATNRATVTIVSDELPPLITAPPAGDPDPAPALGIVALQVGVNPLVASPTFAWAASCPEGPTDGLFSDPAAPAPAWQAPRVPARAAGPVACAISVTVGDGLGAEEVAGFELTVTPGRGAGRVPPLPGGAGRGAP